MTKQELLQDLQNRFYKVGLVEGAEESSAGYLKRVKEGVLWYLVGVYEKRGNVLVRRNIPIYCEVVGGLKKEQKGTLNWEDLPEGNYFYGEKMPEEHTIPEPPKENPFKDYEGEIEKQGKDYAIVRKFVEENGEMVEKFFYVTLKDGKLVEKPIKEG